MTLETTISSSLLVRLRAGERDAWQRIVTTYGPVVHRRCRRKGLETADADDVTQEVFRAVSTGIGQFRREQAGESFEAWLAGIVRHKLADHYRQRERMVGADGGSTARQRLEQLPDTFDADGWGPSELQRDVVRRIADLLRVDFEERTWRAFWLTCVDGKATHEAADSLRMTPGAVRNARSKVRQRLIAEFGEVLGLGASRPS